MKTKTKPWAIKPREKKEMWRKLKCMGRSKRTQSEKVTYCRMPNTWRSGKSKILETVKRLMVISIWKGEGGRRMNRQRTEDFQGCETTLYDAIRMHRYHYTFVQTHRVYNTMNGPWYKLWTLGDYNVPMQVHKYNRSVILVGMLIMGKALHMWGQGVYGKSQCLPLDFALKKTALKK